MVYFLIEKSQFTLHRKRERERNLFLVRFRPRLNIYFPNVLSEDNCNYKSKCSSCSIEKRKLVFFVLFDLWNFSLFHFPRSPSNFVIRSVGQEIIDCALFESNTQRDIHNLLRLYIYICIYSRSSRFLSFDETRGYACATAARLHRNAYAEYGHL